MLGRRLHFRSAPASTRLVNTGLSRHAGAAMKSVVRVSGLCLSLFVSAAPGCSEARHPIEIKNEPAADGGGGSAGRVSHQDTSPVVGDVAGKGSPEVTPVTPTPDASPCGVACTNGARFLLDFPWTFERAANATFTVCRNDRCITGQLPPVVPDPGPDTGVGFSVPDPMGGAEFADISIWGRNGPKGKLYLKLEWTAKSAAALKDGDLYRASIELSNATKQPLLEQRVTYQDARATLPPGTCTDRCAFVERDLTGSDHRTDDAGSP